MVCLGQFQFVILRSLLNPTIFERKKGLKLGFQEYGRCAGVAIQKGMGAAVTCVEAGNRHRLVLRTRGLIKGLFCFERYSLQFGNDAVSVKPHDTTIKAHDFSHLAKFARPRVDALKNDGVNGCGIDRRRDGNGASSERPIGKFKLLGCLGLVSFKIGDTGAKTSLNDPLPLLLTICLESHRNVLILKTWLPNASRKPSSFK